MKIHPKFYLTGEPDRTCANGTGTGLRFLVLTCMRTHWDDDRPAEFGPGNDGGEVVTCAARTAVDLRRLTDREREACVLHLADGWPQETVADWMGLTRRGLQLALASAAAKVPALRSLWARAAADEAAGPEPRPRVLHLSQLGPADAGPFDADDL